MNRDAVLEKIEEELADAAHAQMAGNDGMARVCARRAAGAAIAHWLQSNPRTGWGIDAMSRLRLLQMDATMPQNVREAAMRLTTKATQQFTSPFTTDPVEDCKSIINYLMRENAL